MHEKWEQVGLLGNCKSLGEKVLLSILLEDGFRLLISNSDKLIEKNLDVELIAGTYLPIICKIFHHRFNNKEIDCQEILDYLCNYTKIVSLTGKDDLDQQIVDGVLKGYLMKKFGNT